MNTEGPWAIPSSWSWLRTGDVANVVGGGTPSTSNALFWENGEIPWITPADLSGYAAIHIARGARSITQEGLRGSGARIMPAGTVLLSSRAPVGYVAIASQPVCTNQGFKSFPPSDVVIAEFLYYFLLGNRRLVLEFASGTTFQEVSGKKAALIPVPVPPLAEQRRIVAAIEEHLSRLGAAVAGLNRVQAQMPRYQAAVLTAAMAGRFTSLGVANERNRPAETDGVLPGWTRKQLSSFARTASGGTPRRDNPRFFTGPIPWVKSGELGDGVVNSVEESITESAVLTSSAKVFPKGTLCIALYGATVGKVGILSMDAATNQAVAGIFLPTNVDVRFMFHFLRSIRSELIDLGKGGAQPNISQQIIRDLWVPLPPHKEQMRIVDEIDRRLSWVDEIERVVTTGLARAERLRQSILARAFSGQLVPQDPSDQPASVLLDRVRAGRAKRVAQAAKGRVRRPRR